MAEFCLHLEVTILISFILWYYAYGALRDKRFEQIRLDQAL
jgi:hypothetical protein